MGTKQSQVAEELTKFYEAALLDLPTAAVKRLAGGDEKELAQAGWKAYDAWIRLANEATNRLYENRAVSELTGRAFETVLRAQRIGDALSSALLGNLWPALGLPTASQVQALRDEISTLREEFRASAEVEREEKFRTDHVAEDSLRLIWNGSDNHRTAKGIKSNAA